MIRGLILDLDMCILDTRTVVGPFFDPVLEALRSSDLSAEKKELVEGALLTTSLEDVIEAYSIPSETADPMRDAYRALSAPDGMRTFGDEDALRDLPLTKVLVTSGYERFQRGKVEKLGIASLFDEIIVDSIDVPEKRKGKKAIFAELLEKYGWRPEEALVIGDNPLSELAAGKALGIRVVQTVRPSIVRWDGADAHIESLSELSDLVRAL